MPTFVPKQKTPKQATSAKPTNPVRAESGRFHDVNSVLHLQRSIGNHAVQRLLQAESADVKGGSRTISHSRFAHDFTSIPVHKLEASCDVNLGQDAQRWFAPTREGPRLDAVPEVSYPEHNFARVRVHTDAESARTAQILNSLAYTLGDEITFAPGMYQPGTAAGRVLLSHELGHVVQAEEGSGGIRRQVADPQADRGPAVVQRMVRSAIQEMDSGDPSYKVLLQTWILAGKHAGLRQFGLALAERPHPQYGTYLNCFLIYLHARGSERLAGMVVAEFNKAGLRLLKSGEQPLGQEDVSLPSATGAGLGSVLVYEGKTLVKIGGTDFYISGKPPDYWKGKTTSVLFVVNKNQPKKMYRLDFDVLKQGPKVGVRGWEHNQKGVAKVLGLQVTNHQPAGGWARAAGRAIQMFKWGGRALFVVGVGSELVEIHYALDRTRAVLGGIASVGGAAGGAVAGAAAGARIPGPWFVKAGGVLIGGAAGGWAGSKLAKAATQMAYDYFVTPLDGEEWIAFDESQVEVPQPEATP